MRFFVIFTILVCIAFPVFSQNANQQRFNALSDSMGSTVSRSNDTLADFNSRLKDNSDVKIYTSYKHQYEYLISALRDSENEMERMFRTNDRVAYLQKERDHYEELIKRLESTKSEYDNFVRSVR